MIRAVSKILKLFLYLIVHKQQESLSEYILKRGNCTHDLITPFFSFGVPTCPCPDAQIIFTLHSWQRQEFIFSFTLQRKEFSKLPRNFHNYIKWLAVKKKKKGCLLPLLEGTEPSSAHSSLSHLGGFQFFVSSDMLPYRLQKKQQIFT